MIGVKEFEKKKLVFVFTNEGEKLFFKNDNLCVLDSEKKIKFQTTCWRISALLIVGQITITSGLVERSHRFCFPIFLMKSNLRTYDVIGFKALGNTMLKRRQYDYCGIEVARSIVSNKIENQRRELLRQRHRTQDTNVLIASLSELSTKAAAVSSLQELLGIEGSASRIYFPEVFNNCEWKGRKPRVKPDYINCALDIGYTLLFNFVESMLYYFGFDLYVGMLHREFYMRKSLVCDLVEPFRPLVDHTLRKAISLGQCQRDHFFEENGSFRLNYQKNKDYILIFAKPLIDIRVDAFVYVRDFYRAFMKQDFAQLPRLVLN